MPNKRSTSKSPNHLDRHVTPTKSTQLPTKRSLLQLFLPVGYPTSVRTGYMEYQTWDMIQGLTSYLRGNLAYQSMLVGLGVGDVQATATAGALTKIVRDTCSMLGSLLFTYFFSDDFGYDVRQWRLFADISNDIGLTLHFVAPLCGKEWFVTITIVASLMTTMCGISAGSTKAYISSHFALENNLTDLVAKEGSQETAVNIIGLLGGYALLHSVGTVDQSGAAVFLSFFVLTVIHVIANVFAIHYLTFDYLNETRFQLVVQRDGAHMDYKDICRQEPFLPGCSRRSSKYHDCQVRLGSDHRLFNQEVTRAVTVKHTRETELPFIIVVEDLAAVTGGVKKKKKRERNTTIFHVLLHVNATPTDILQGRYECEMVLKYGTQLIHMAPTFDEFHSKLMQQGWDVSKTNFKVGRTRYSSWPKV